jgi:SAC3 family protein LENG8/THP3
MNNQSHAYIPVPARSTFGPSHTLAPPPTYIPAPLPSTSYVPPPPSNPVPNTVASQTAQPPRQKVQWSPAVRDYVNRSFGEIARDISKEDIEKKLKEIITDATQHAKLDLIDWKTYPLPQQLIREDRNRVLLAPVSSPSFIAPPLASAGPDFQPYSTNDSRTDGLRKRKSTEMSGDNDDNNAVQPPWRFNAAPNAGPLAARITNLPTEKRPKLDMSKSVSNNNSNLESRRRRFDLDMRGGSNSPHTQGSSRAVSPERKDNGPIVGRSQKLEKNYFRLTSAPNPDDVRPLEVLKKTLELLKKKWRAENNYAYICDQFKSLRQDLTVQHIKNEFTTSVYEYHARIALEKADTGEYNQCQTQLRELYKQNLGGHPVEFKAYRILYLTYTCNQTDMNDVLSDLTPTDKKQPAIKHALEVRSALALGNYHKFFKLYLTVPDMGAYLMDKFVGRERLAALAYICRS